MYFEGVDVFLVGSLTRRIGIVLLENILQNPHTIISYGEVSRRIGGLVSPRFLGEYLGELSCFCSHNGLPLISAIVYNDKDSRPGDGFYRAFYVDGLSEKKKFDIFNNSIMEIRAHRAEWIELLDLLKHFKAA